MILCVCVFCKRAKNAKKRKINNQVEKSGISHLYNDWGLSNFFGSYERSIKRERSQVLAVSPTRMRLDRKCFLGLLEHRVCVRVEKIIRWCANLINWFSAQKLIFFFWSNSITWTELQKSHNLWLRLMVQKIRWGDDQFHVTWGSIYSRWSIFTIHWIHWSLGARDRTLCMRFFQQHIQPI